ncbi:MAG TPA: glycosyltransferase [Candidatus Krumholzibacteria bacterium]|nr:glycosyltransferase [Candidatus Krumholzibacteria bacterium]
MSDTTRQKLLMIAYFFPPAGAVGVYRTLKFAKYLPEFGWAPCILTTSNGRFPTYDASLARLIPDGVPVHRCAGFELLNEGLRRPAAGPRRKTLWSRVHTRLYLAWNWVALPDTRIGWVPSAFFAAWRIVRREHIEHVYISGSPFSSFLIGAMLKGFARVRVTIDYRDPWTQNINYARRTALHRRLDRALERWVVGRSDVVISNTRFNDGRMFSEFGDGGDREKFVAIHNGFDADDFAAIAREATDKFTITYAGAFYYSIGSNFQGGAGDDVMKTYSPLYFFEALQQFFARRPDAKERTRVRFMGVLGQGYDPVIRERGLESVVERLGYIDYDAHLRVLRNSDALLLVLSRGEKSRGWIPSKFFQYLGTGNPILALAPEGEVRDIIRETRGGLVVEPDDAAAASRAVEELYDSWASGTSIAHQDPDAVARFERRNLTERLARALQPRKMV